MTGQRGGSSLQYAAMKLLDYTTEAALLPRLVCADLEGAVISLAGAMATAGLVSDADRLVRDVLAREAEGGTALPEGLVLPHARSGAAGVVRLGAASLVEPIVCHSGDGEDYPVDVVMLLTGPPGDPRAMLKVLARVAREVRAGALVPRLRQARDRAAMAAVLAGMDA
jgi:mannitol/fructose-specific phosphotransferase system IIA component (Ntr-type)